jgi:GNAT superfamily N-acetyltransferase
MRVVRADPPQADMHALFVEAHLSRARYREVWANASSPPLEVMSLRLRLAQSSKPDYVWHAWEGGQVIGSGRLSIFPGVTNAAAVSIYVLPRYRCAGVGMALFNRVLACAKALHLETLELTTFSCIPAGTPFVARLAANAVQCVSVLELSIAPSSIPDDDAASMHESGLRIVVTAGASPVGDLPSIVEFREMVRRSYGRPLRHVDPRHSLQRERRRELLLQQSGIERWTILAFAGSNGMAGYSEYEWDPYEPRVLRHVALSVAEAYRGRDVEYQLMHSRTRIIAARPSISVVRVTHRCRHDPARVSGGGRYAPAGHHRTRWRLRASHA